MKYRAIGFLTAVIIYFAYTSPRLFFGLILFCAIGYSLILHWNRHNHTAEEQLRRKLALNKARIFLSPYKSIWGDLKLSNKNCYLYLGKDGVLITGKEKVFPYRKFRILSSAIHSYTDLWDMFCVSFGYNTTYDGLTEKCRVFQVSIYENIVQKPKNNKSEQDVTKRLIKQNSEKLDINNCSEIELTELPGISIVMAKRVIKKREEIGGFKTIDDFFLFLKLKYHMVTQLREKIIVKNMKISQNITKNSERSVDL